MLREIGRGGMATVYAAMQPDLEREVALKELSTFHAGSPEFAHRFLRESRLAGSLNHPNIVTVHEYFQDAGIPYIAMEYVSRGSLRLYLDRLSVAEIAGVLEGVLAGLAHAESAGIVHRDLKPENIMVTRDGRVKIADFGIAKATQTAGTAFLTATGITVGTPTYMAPEQAMAENMGPWTDLYSVGVVAYELLVGRVPFDETEAPMVTLMRHVNEAIPPAKDVKPDIDPGLSDWIDALLVKDPAQRVQHAAAAWDLLEEIIVRLLGPLWRREARLLERAAAPKANRPLTPAPFESQPVQQSAPSPSTSEFVTFGPATGVPNAPERESATPASPSPPMPPVSAEAPLAAAPPAAEEAAPTPRSETEFVTFGQAATPSPEIPPTPPAPPSEPPPAASSPSRDRELRPPASPPEVEPAPGSTSTPHPLPEREPQPAPRAEEAPPQPPRSRPEPGPPAVPQRLPPSRPPARRGERERRAPRGGRYRWPVAVGVALTAGAVAAIVALTSGSSSPRPSPQAVPTASTTLPRVPKSRVTGSGTATVRLTGNAATVAVEMHGLLNGSPHLLHIHAAGQGACPTASAARLHNGHLAISTHDGIKFYGPVVTSLTSTGDTSPKSFLDFSRYSTAGTARYRRTMIVSGAVAASIRHDNAVVVLHGIDYNGNGVYDNALDRSELNPALPGEATAPALCGALGAPKVASRPLSREGTLYTASLKVYVPSAWYCDLTTRAVPETDHRAGPGASA